MNVKDIKEFDPKNIEARVGYDGSTAYCCYFKHDGEVLYADCAITFDRGLETMIFGVNEEGEINYSDEKYVNWHMKDLKKFLQEDIEDFIANKH